MLQDKLKQIDNVNNSVNIIKTLKVRWCSNELHVSIWNSMCLFSCFTYSTGNLQIHFFFFLTKCALPKNQECLRDFERPGAPDRFSRPDDQSDHTDF